MLEGIHNIAVIQRGNKCAGKDTGRLQRHTARLTALAPLRDALVPDLPFTNTLGSFLQHAPGSHDLQPHSTAHVTIFVSTGWLAINAHPQSVRLWPSLALLHALHDLTGRHDGVVGATSRRIYGRRCYALAGSSTRLRHAADTRSQRTDTGWRRRSRRRRTRRRKRTKTVRGGPGEGEGHYQASVKCGNQIILLSTSRRPNEISPGLLLLTDLIPLMRWQAHREIPKMSLPAPSAETAQ